MITHENVANILIGLDDIEVETLDHYIDFADQGFDSLDIIHVMFGIEEQYNIEIEEDSIANNEWNSVDKIVEQLNKIKCTS
jgi:acyl carrier protein